MRYADETGPENLLEVGLGHAIHINGALRHRTVVVLQRRRWCLGREQNVVILEELVPAPAQPFTGVV